MTTKPLAVRDQAVVALFFGVVIGIDTHGRPELDCDESLSADAIASLRTGPVGDDHWSILRFTGSRSGALMVTTWALVFTTPPMGDVVDLPALPGRWWIDEMQARPRNAGRLVMTPAMCAPLVVDAVAAAALRGLADDFEPGVRDRLLQLPCWNVLALVDLKHS